MHMFAKERAGELSGILALPDGAPPADAFERVFKRLDGEALAKCLRDYGQRLLPGLSGKQIILDGKKLKGASPASLGNSGLYLLNARVGGNKFCLGQRQAEDKSNGITAIPELLDSIDIAGASVAIDAIGTQRKIAERTRNKNARCLLSVKGNQQELLDGMECAFKAHKGYGYCEELDCGHGRIETRKCSISRAEAYLLEENLLPWKDIYALVKAESIREENGMQGKGVRCFINDENVDKARCYNSLVRDHWPIENSLHWHLDVTFKEDACRTGSGHAPGNLSVIRKFALQLIAKQKDKPSLKKRLYKAALDINYLKKIIQV
ncbi:putative transposase YncI [Bacteroidia bacterium]|nr:putative transposase YncI [Bacteroidia bacterium]